MGALAGLGAAARLRALSMMRNSSSPNFGDPFFHALRRCRSEQHTSRGRKRKIRIFEPSRGSDTPQTRPLKNFRFLWRYTLLLAVPQAVPPQVVADSPLAGEGSWVQPDRETLLTRLERVYAAGIVRPLPRRKPGFLPRLRPGSPHVTSRQKWTAVPAISSMARATASLNSQANVAQHWRANSSPNRLRCGWRSLLPEERLGIRPSRPSGSATG
jgi:hypothetical protein